MPQGRDFQKAQIRDGNAEALIEAGDDVTIKRVAGAAAGDPTKGIGVTYSFTKTKSRGIIEALTQTDVLNGGGFYQIGDVKAQLNESLTEVSDLTGNVGDRVIWRGVEWRIVGKKMPEVIANMTPFYSYTLRKVNP